MSVIKINGVAIKDPSELMFTLQDFDSETSQRNANGQMNRDRICANKRKLQLSFPLLSNSEISTILQAITPVFFNVTFLDPLTGREATVEMYVGDRSGSVYKIVDGEAKWEGLSFSLIER